MLFLDAIMGGWVDRQGITYIPQSCPKFATMDGAARPMASRFALGMELP
jgi:hypothetical protein